MAKVWLNNKLQKLAMKKKNAYVTRVVTLPQISGTDLVDAAARNSGIDRGTFTAALDALNKEFQNYLIIGHSVEVPHIGCFRFMVNAYAKDTQAEAGAAAVHRRKLHYQANKELWSLVQRASLEDITPKEEEEEEPEGD